MFFKHLFSEDTDAYWQTISGIDQSRVYGMYREDSKKSYYDGVSFHEYVQDIIHPEHAGLYDGVKDKPGVSNTIKYNDKGEAIVQILGNVQVTRHYIAPTIINNNHITLACEMIYCDGILMPTWKVRIYSDHLYSCLTIEASC